MLQKQGSTWAILSILVFARLSLGANLQLPGSLAPFMRSEIGLALKDVGILASALTIAGVIFAIPQALIAQKWGDRRVTTFGMLLMALSCLVSAFGQSFWDIFGARIVGGIGAVFISITMPKIVADLFDDRDRAAALTTLLASFPIGVGSSLILQPLSAEIWGWRAAFLCTAAFTGVGAALLLLLPKDEPHERQETVAWGLPKLSGTVAVTGGLWAAFNCALVSVLAFGPLYLVDKGVTAQQSASVVSMTLAGHLIGMFAGGYIERRTALSRNSIMLVSFSLLAASVYAIPFDFHHDWIFLAIGAFAAIPVGSAASLPFAYLEPKDRVIGMGVYQAAHYAVLALLPPIAGAIADFSGKVEHAFFVSAAFPVISILMLISLPHIADHNRIKLQ